MALSNSILLIRDYENIRKILRDIYIFGCFSRDDFIERGISGRKYDNEQRRINAYLPEHFIQKRRENRKVLQYCSYKIEDNGDNYLADTFRNKSFTLLDIMAFFFVQQILSEEEGLTIAELLERLPDGNSEVVFTKDNIRIKLEELQQRGYIVARKERRNIRYYLTEDIWRDFSDEELENILIYLDYKRNSSPIEMPYYFLYRKLKLYMFAERGISLDTKIFQYKHNHQFNVLDNDILLCALQGIAQGVVLRAKVSVRENIVMSDIIPVQVIHDSVSGRQYLIGIKEEERNLLVLRIDKIEELVPGRGLSEEEKQMVNAQTGFEQECWCASGAETAVTDIEIAFSFHEETEKYIYNRIVAEGHNGTIDKVKDGEYIYRNQFRDLGEMIPWIRSFGERARVLSSGASEIEKVIAQDWDKAVKKYEAF